MQFIFSLAITLTLGFSMLQCGKINLENGKSSGNKMSNTTNTVVNTNNNAITSPQPAQTGDEAPRISLADAKKDFDDGNAIFVDTRQAPSYDEEHVKGATNLSADMFDAHYKELPKDKKIIAYCS